MKMRLLVWLFFLLVSGLATLAFLLALATSPQPGIERPARISLADLERGRRIVESLDLRNLKEGQERQLDFAARDMELALNWLAGSLGRGGAEVVIDGKSLEVRASLRLYTLPRYLNLTLGFQPQGKLLQPVRLLLGKVPLPAEFTGKVLAALLALSPASEQYQVLRSMLRGARIRPGHLQLTLVWHGEAMKKAMAQSTWSPEGIDSAALEPYREHLAGVASRDFARLLGAAFTLAKARSVKGDPLVENRSAITVLAESALGGRLFTSPQDRKPRRKGGAVLMGRDDFAQHFALSAFLSVVGGEGMSNLVGLYKELRDARQGSGFSFTDLAADMAGSRLGEYATRSPEMARQLQARLAGSQDAALYFPQVKDLPEFMNQSQFEQRFGGVGEPAYGAQVREIEARIARLPLYRK